MRLARKSRFVTALFALVSVLFMQLALAAYACPSLRTDQAVAISATSPAAGHEGLVGCESIVDLEQLSLCQAHAQYGSQSLDKPAMPDLAPSVTVVLVPAIKAPDPASRRLNNSADASWLMRGISPPLSIRNCCFRI